MISPEVIIEEEKTDEIEAESKLILDKIIAYKIIFMLYILNTANFKIKSDLF